ncbi:histidinol dehydrogenase [Buchnera aphidicola]|uniref:histidinol dehydrogenase n=1 Tax=Buchnera aphidicola TaxID=9 RepID=UPI00094D9FE0|nr:histidinol dehydrogenase [Buchnera aphidicola]
MINVSKKIINWHTLTHKEKITLLKRPNINVDNIIKKSISQIIRNVKKNGDSALHAYSLKFDRVKVNDFYVSQSRINNSDKYVSPSFQKAVLVAKDNIHEFHSKQVYPDLDVQTYPGVRCQHITRPIHSVGLYVPKGSFPLVSTALMLLVPARIAKCSNIVLCSPPPISNEILYIAKILGVDSVLELGGAHAIAALALGTQTIKRVDKIFGPGNIFVTEAKLQVSRRDINLSIDMPAGPSEVLIIADHNSHPAFIASDLLSQAEHDINAQVILVSTSSVVAKQVINEFNHQLQGLSRKKIILSSWQNSKIIITQSLLESFEVSNLYAPEHLILHIDNARNYLSHIHNAGSVFLGKWTPGSAGDYVTGANHVLPTYGHANTFSSLRVSDFQKVITIQKMTKHSLQDLSCSIKELSLSEGMDAHHQSVIIRTNSLKKTNVINE